ncbi:putative lactoylglutathione chloroplast isoform A [Micractinium conductrix]|uniref:lactoylglutathione lyase n=1 Tax=Micractinium conductrix TaxID=554055 RepID=A0A2P6VRS4_9CHLO|nr:putative lactoylglutathione chloroplast isoform A [Micractinium conductrix]|eukprot:PSC76770.1 putative lactoylglutathione chloroplast isoform A [Micractinium conductrix]
MPPPQPITRRAGAERPRHTHAATATSRHRRLLEEAGPLTVGMLRLQIWNGLGPLQPRASPPCARARASLRGPLRAGVLAPLSILARQAKVCDVVCETWDFPAECASRRTRRHLASGPSPTAVAQRVHPGSGGGVLHPASGAASGSGGNVLQRRLQHHLLGLPTKKRGRHGPESEEEGGHPGNSAEETAAAAEEGEEEGAAAMQEGEILMRTRRRPLRCWPSTRPTVAAALLFSALQLGAPVLLAGSGDRQACFATLLAKDLLDLDFSVEACQPDQAGLPFCRPADATSFIVLRSPGHPGAPCPPPPAAWLQQQQRHPPPEPPSGPAATSDNGVVYGILQPHLLPPPPPQQQQPQQAAPGLRPAADAREAAQHAPLLPPPVQLQLQLLQLLQPPPPQPPPLDVREPADLMAVFQQARPLSLAYGGSTLRGLPVRLREHEAELLAGTHSCLQSQEQPGIDLLRAVLPNEAAVQLVYRAHLVSRSFVLAAVSADSLGGDRSQMEVLVAAAEQAVIDASRATALNRSLDVGPRFVSMPGTCVATGAAGAAAAQQQALDLYDDPKYYAKQGGKREAAAAQQQALDLYDDPKYYAKQGGKQGAAAAQQQALDLYDDPKYYAKQGGKQGAAATNGFANKPIYSCGGEKWHLYRRKTDNSWEATGDPLTKGSTALPKNPSCVQLGRAAATLIYPAFDARAITLSLAPIDGAPANYAEVQLAADPPAASGTVPPSLYRSPRQARRMAAVPAAAAAGWAAEDERRMLHAVYRVGDMDKTIQYYKECFGMQLLRYRDISEEKYSNAFLGYGPETTHFAMELTYNYGVDSYDLGEGFGHFGIATADVYKMVEAVKAKGGKVSREPGPVKGGKTHIAFVEDPTGYKFELIQREGDIPEPLAQVMLRVGDLDRSIKFYTEVLGMKLIRTRENPEYKYTLAFLGYGPEESNCVFELTYNWGKESYSKGNAYAQVAISTKDVYKTAQHIKAAGGNVTRDAGPVPGIGTKITACLDPDGYKIVFVDNEDFLKELEQK